MDQNRSPNPRRWCLFPAPLLRQRAFVQTNLNPGRIVMNSSQPSLPIARRLSLPVQVADAIRQAIQDGGWDEHLPGERHLCEMLQVSRPTLRRALHLLAQEGQIEIRPRCRIRLAPGSLRRSRRPNRLVGLITAQPISRFSFAMYQVISEMRAQLAGQGFATEVLECPPASARAQQRKCEEFVQQHRVFCCVLLSVGADLQRWFALHSIPALVFGTCHAEVKLPSIDIDHRSVCRHATGVFLSRGHRRLVLIVPDSHIAGDLASEQGFREAVAHHPRRETIHATVVRHNGTARQIGGKLDALFHSNQAPTALLVAKPQHVFIVLIYLLSHGLIVPNTVSFIARDYDQIFETVSPPIAHYALAEHTFARRLSRLMLRLANQGYLPIRPHLIFPKFIAGGTVAHCGNQR